jgi:hypothetical protein
MSIVIAGVAEVLKEARKLLPDEEHWTKGAYFRRLDDDGKAFCLVGAVARATRFLGPKGTFSPRERYDFSKKHLLTTIRKRTRRSYPSILHYNDAPGRTYKQIIGVLDAAIAAAEKEEANVGK